MVKSGKQIYIEKNGRNPKKEILKIAQEKYWENELREIVRGGLEMADSGQEWQAEIYWRKSEKSWK